MTGPLFFGTYDAGDVGIPRLSVGCDRSLDESSPIVFLRGEDEDGALLFSHTLIALDTFDDVEALSHGLRYALDDPPDPGRHEGAMRELLNVVRRVQGLRRNEARLRLLARHFADGERLVMADEGATTLVWCEHPFSVTVERWGGHVRTCDTLDEAIQVALYDLGLPRTDTVVTEFGVRGTHVERERAAGAWRGIVEALGEHGLVAGVTDTGGGCKAISVDWSNDRGDHALLTGAGPLFGTTDRDHNAGENWTLGFYREGHDPTTIILDGTDVARTDDDGRVANLVAALVMTGFAESSGGFD